jgi:hypothetical protein
MSNYFFIIWEHGLSNIDKVINIIQDTSNITINNIYDLSMPQSSLLNFLLKLYNNENKQHIIGKNIHLIKEKKQNYSMKIIFINNNDGNYFIDRGTKKNITIEYLKRKLRNKFNPKFKDKSKQIYPLDIGVSHEHIIHSNDTPEEMHNFKLLLKKYALVN